MAKTEYDMYRYFDDIAEHIEILETEESILDDSEHRDVLQERIAYLKKREIRGDKWVDNDMTASPDAWKTLETYTETEARRKFREWD